MNVSRETRSMFHVKHAAPTDYPVGGSNVL